MISLGIDPGLSGGAATIDDGDGIELFATPVLKVARGHEYDEQLMVDWLLGLVSRGRVTAAIEEQRSFPGQGVRSMFTTGFGFGLWRGMLAAAGIPYVVVRPQVWRPGVGSDKSTGGTAKERKSASVAHASRLFPEAARKGMFHGPRGGIRDGVAEALLIAEYNIRRQRR